MKSDTLFKQAGVTAPPHAIYSRITGGMYVTAWNPEDPLYGTLYLVIDVRLLDSVDPYPVKGLVLATYDQNTKQDAKKLYARYPKGVDLNALPDYAYLEKSFSRFVPVLPLVLVPPGVLDKAPEFSYKPEDFIRYIQDVRLEKIKRIKTYTTEHYGPILMGMVREYCTYFLHVDYHEKLRVAVLPDPLDFATAVATMSGEDFYVPASSYIRRNLLTVYMEGTIVAQFQIGEDWDQKLLSLLTQWQDAKITAKPSR